MPPIELTVRVRPSKVAILLGRTASVEEFALAVRFLSRLWGGRYCAVLPVDPDGRDEYARSWLERNLPELVYGIGVNDEAWAEIVHDTGFIRGYSQLRPDFAENFFRTPYGYHAEDLITFRPVLRWLQQEPGVLGRRRLRLLSCDMRAPLGPFAAAALGLCEPELLERTDVLDHKAIHVGGATSTADFLRLWMDVTRSGHSWLDVTSLGLDVHLHDGSGYAPALVLVRSVATDLALFWTLRTASDSDLPRWIVPVPIEDAEEPAVLDALAEWVRHALSFRFGPEAVLVTSLTADLDSLERLADELRSRVEGAPIAATRAETVLGSLPVITVGERPQTVSADLTDHVLTWRPPRPMLAAYLGDCGTWVVDFTRDRRTERAPGELALPPRRAALEALNAPTPPMIRFDRVLRYGVGFSGLHLRCRQEDEVERHRLPTAHEVLTAVLEECGVSPRPDEKRTAYLPAIALFGGLGQAAAAFTGPSWQAMQALRKGPCLLDQIMNATRLGRRDLPELAPPGDLERVLSGLPPIRQRLARERFDSHLAARFPTEATLPGLIDMWTDRGVLRRRWQLAKCSGCGLTGWADHLDIRQPVVCAGCGTRLRLPAEVPLGFELNALVGRAICQGLGPVALTGQFLRQLSTEGFLWLPGMKYVWNGKEGDIDFLACCDRRLVMAECKDLAGAGPESPTWPEVFDQFRDLLEVARACRVGLVVLAVRAAEFPPGWEEQLSELLDGATRVLLLTGENLERGNTYDPRGNMRGYPLTLSEIMAKPPGVLRARR